MGLSQHPTMNAHPEFCYLSGKELLSRSQAKSQAKRARNAVNMNAYQCRACGAWHVGNRRRFAA